MTVTLELRPEVEAQLVAQASASGLSLEEYLKKLVELQARMLAAKPAQTMSDEQMFAQNIKDVYFDYDKSDVRADQQAAVQADVAFLQQHASITFTIEGHCDERGSTEYNLALGDNRANSVKNALVQGGVSADRIKTISYGKEKPFCTQSNEQCWQQNRRGHFVYQK